MNEQHYERILADITGENRTRNELYYKLRPMERLLVDIIGESRSHRNRLERYFYLNPLSERTVSIVKDYLKGCIRPKCFLRESEYYVLCKRYGIDPGDVQFSSKKKEEELFESAMRKLKCCTAIELSYLILDPGTLENEIWSLKTRIKRAIPLKHGPLEEPYMILFRYYAAAEAYRVLSGKEFPQDLNPEEPKEDSLERLLKD